MTIKKPAKEGGAAIADRFRLEAPAPKGKPAAAVGGVALNAALGAACVAILVAGVLAYTLWKHWEFLMPA